MLRTWSWHVYKNWCVYTCYRSSGTRCGLTGTDSQCHTVTPMFACNCKRGGADMGVRWTCIHVLMHVHIVIKMWELKWGHWDTTTVPHKGTQVSISLFKGGETDMVSQVDMYTCTDACTHFNQYVGPQARWMGHTHTATQGHPGFHVNYP